MNASPRMFAGLLVLGCVLGAGALASAQRPTPQRPVRRPGTPPATRPLNGLLPKEREFLELDVDLGTSAPFPRDNPSQSTKQLTPLPSREVARQTPPTSPSVPVELMIPVSPVQWRQDFESAQRRPIEAVVFGKGPKHIAVLSSLSGNSEPTVALVEKMAGVLARDQMIPIQLSVLVVRCPNPDGAAERMLTNSHGVDLNRNFPSTRFTASPRRETGEKPGSEPETRALIQLLNQFQPEMVVHVIESRSTRGTVRSDDFVPRDLLPRFDSAPYDHVYKTGSLAGYVHETMKRGVVEVELPTDATATVNEETLLQLMVTTLDQSARSVRTQLMSKSSLAQQDQESPSTREAGQVRPDGLRGNVEFLPPPPDAPAIAEKPRYIELPPPPG